MKRKILFISGLLIILLEIISTQIDILPGDYFIFLEIVCMCLGLILGIYGYRKKDKLFDYLGLIGFLVPLIMFVWVLYTFRSFKLF